MRPFIPLFALLFTLACGSDKKNKPEADFTSTGPNTEADGTEQAAATKLTACYQADEWTCAVEAEIVRLTNALRTKPMTQVYEDSYVVRLWSQEQADAGKISHDGFPKDRRAALKAAFPYATWGYNAENVAMTGRGGVEAEAVAKQFVDMWYNSEGHRKNMLGNFKSIGVGVFKKGNAVYATQIFH